MMTTRDRSAAEEITQDAFLRAHNNLHRYDTARPFYPWLATIAVRLAFNWTARTGARRSTIASGVDVDALPTADASPAQRVADEQQARALWAAVAELSPGERTAVLLFYKDELPVADIAGILGVSTGTVKTFLHRGRAHLRAQLGRQEKSDEL